MNEFKEFSLEEAIKWFRENPFYHKDHVPFNMAIKALEALREKKPETVTEFADRCRECGAKYGKLLKSQTGHWIKTISENWVTSAVRCSECGFEDNRYTLFRYCPDCGARMEVEKNG